jgi:hypothetical protein
MNAQMPEQLCSLGAQTEIETGIFDPSSPAFLHNPMRMGQRLIFKFSIAWDRDLKTRPLADIHASMM